MSKLTAFSSERHGSASPACRGISTR